MKFMYLFVLLTAALADEELDAPIHKRSKRSLYTFNNLIRCYFADVSVSLYFDYGCYCGKGGYGIPLDETDMCCYVHDQCYGQVYNKYLLDDYSYQLYTTSYDFTCANKIGHCNATKNGDFQQALCECDRVAAECFMRNRNTFSLALKDVDQEDCCKVPNTDCGVQGAPHIPMRLYGCSRSGSQDMCCGSKGYNSDHYFCCGSQLYKKLPESSSKQLSCCYNKLYDVNNSLCCRGTLHQGGDSIECCGAAGAVVDLRNQICKNGTAVFK